MVVLKWWYSGGGEELTHEQMTGVPEAHVCAATLIHIPIYYIYVQF